ncbi:MAG: T9SS type A sorting domain-containing protein, partial [Saprospiraceae bacterium]|nr:T9SS type A sorting domain-containing protein [Saprospiraceae bacterium]
NNPTWVIADNNYSFDQQFLVTTHRVGPLGDNDSLYFDYRFVNWFAGTTATTLNGDSLNVYISDDCEETFTRVFTIDQFNHTPTTNFTTVGVDLSTYANKAINVRFEQKWAVSGDYWTDLDNINVTGCPAFFLFDANIVDATGSDKSDGSISLTGNVLGTGPFTFEWEDLPPDSSVNVLTGLLPGNYLVTITDAMGCTEQRVITVGVSTGTIEAPFLDRFDLFPNPTNGSAVIDLVLQETSDLRLQVYNSVGQLLVDLEEDGVRQLRREIDLGQYPAGMYFVKVAVEDQWHLAKLILAK